jgi:hypothetical protein
MLCARCNETLPRDGEFVTCKGCSSDAHFECSGLRESTYRGMSNQKKNEWRCINCRTGKNRTTSVSTIECTNVQDTIQQINKKLEILMEMNNKIEDVQKHVTSITEELKIYKEKVIKLEKIIENKERAIESLESRVMSLEQYSRKNNIEIIGVDKTKEENLEQIFEVICNKLKLTDVSREDIETIHRIPNINSRKESIIVQLKSRNVREKILSKRKTEIRNSDIVGRSNSPTQDSSIYIRENQSKEFKKLFWDVKTIARENGFKFIWSKNGKILIRKNENSRIIQIHSVNEIKSMVR